MQNKNNTTSQCSENKIGSVPPPTAYYLSPHTHRLPPTAYSKGFTILFAVLISSVMLAVGIAIFNITVRELRLSSVVRDSEKAIYAADSGGECALYNAFKLRLFDVTGSNTWFCNGQTFSGIGGNGYGDITSPPNPNYANATSSLQLVYSNGTCATVLIGQHVVNQSTGQVRTIVESHGYNVCDTANPARVERVFRIIF